MSNLPNGKLKELEVQQPEAVKQVVSSLRELNALGRPETDQEIKNRIDDYFEFCERSSLRPGIESLCCALHITRQTLFRWSKGESCSRERQEIIQRAKGFIAAFIEQVSLSNRLNPATSIFLMKNWMGYRDTLSFDYGSEEKHFATPDLPSLALKYGVELNDSEEKQNEPPTPEF